MLLITKLAFYVYTSGSVYTSSLAVVAETGFSHRFTAYKIVGHFLDCHIRRYPGVIRSKIVFFRSSNISVPCPHAQLRVRTVKKLWTFFGLSGRDCSQSRPCWIFQVKQVKQSIHGLREDDKVNDLTPVIFGV